MGLSVSILSSLFIVNISLFLLLTFFVLIVYIFLFTFMLAYCVHRLSSLKACVLSEQFGENKSKIQKGGLITELWQLFSVRSCCRMY